MVRVDYPEPHAYLHGVQAHDASRAIYAYVQLTPTVSIHPSPLKFPGLDQSANYVIKAVFPAGKPRFMLITPPEWMSGITLSGSALSAIGVTAPILAPANACLIEITKA
jgi:alpha-galactosidase